MFMSKKLNRFLELLIVIFKILLNINYKNDTLHKQCYIIH